MNEPMKLSDAEQLLRGMQVGGLNAERLRTGLSLRDVTEMTGIDETLLRAYEQGRILAPLHHLWALADAYELEPEQLASDMIRAASE